MAFTDLLVFAVMLFAVGIAFLFGGIIIRSFADQPYVNASTTTINGTTINPAAWMISTYQKFDWLFVAFFAFLCLGMFISGFMIPSHPVFTVIGLLGIIIYEFIAPYISNLYLLIAQLSVASTVINDFPLMSAIIFQLPAIGLAVGVISAMLTYGKNPFAIR